MLSTPSSCLQGDYHRYLAEFKTGAERKEAAEHTLLAYKAAQVRSCRGHVLGCRLHKLHAAQRSVAAGGSAEQSSVAAAMAGCMAIFLALGTGASTYQLQQEHQCMHPEAARLDSTARER